MELGSLRFNQRLKLTMKLTIFCIKELRKMQAQVNFESFPIYSWFIPHSLFLFQCLPSQDPTVMNIQRKSPLQNQNGILTLSLARHSMKPTSKSTCQGGPRCHEIHPCLRSAALQQTPKKRSLCTSRWWVTFSETSGRKMMTRVRLCMRR